MSELGSTDNPNRNDLVIHEGFPVLNTFRLPKIGEKLPNSEEELIPKYQFASFPSALVISQEQRKNVMSDCESVFTARTKEDSDAYSSGATFFLPASIKPRCALEDLAMNIFRAHTKDLEPGKHFDLERSGAEWWTLVLETSTPSNRKIEEKGDGDCNSEEDDDDGDEVGMHFDADYGLEDQLPNYMLHPRIATVTYLSDVGVPTLVLDKRSPPPKDLEKKTLNGSIEHGWLSYPIIGKHIAFDGRLLHGAPGSFFPSLPPMMGITEDKSEEEPATKRRKIQDGDGENVGVFHDDSSTKRITFMVNVWLNHCPIDAEPIDEALCAQLKTEWEPGAEEETGNGIKLKRDADFDPSLQWLPNNALVHETPDRLCNEKVSFAEEESDWAGIEEVILCNREVDVLFCSTKKDLQDVAKKAQESKEKSLEIQFVQKALQLKVGSEVSESESEGDGGDI